MAALVLAIGGAVFADYWRSKPADFHASFVGRDQCVSCHQDQAESFLGSHHDLAMDRATDETVLGNFDDVVFEHHGLESRLFRDGDRFMIHTEGEDGQMHDFEIRYVFGVDPLQQYMVEFDRDDSLADGELPRLQVLRISWDTHKEEWFYLAPPDVDEKLEPDDPLHWTGIAQRWQTMCADCHSTNLKKNFDVASGTYHTTFTDIDVSCEACHGPGSLHVELANSKSLFWDRHHGYGLARLRGDDPEPQLQACAPCHSRRGLLDDDFVAGNCLSDHYDVERLTEATYHADGQIKDEVYVYGSFIQSKMYHQGIRCTDCHDPHSAQLKHPGNQTCTSCHQHSAGKYDTPSHHFHAVGTEGAQCVSCHMPHTTYMAVDARRDHSLRVPRPDLSVRLGTPNACSSCHIEDKRDSLSPNKSAELVHYADWLSAADAGDEEVRTLIDEVDRWCDEACDRWYGLERQTPPHFAEAIVAFRRGENGAVSRLLRLASSDDRSLRQPTIAVVGGPRDAAAAPEIARASMLDELWASPDALKAVRTAKEVLGDETQGDMVRASAARVLGLSDPETLRRWLIPVIDDESKLVRTEAARSIIQSGIYPTLSGRQQADLDEVVEEIFTGLEINDDRAGSHLSRAMIEEGRGRLESAIVAYEQAIAVEPNMTGARTNLAHLLEANRSRFAAARRSDLDAKVQQLRRDELPLLARDAELAPQIAPVQYRYGLALYLDGQIERAADQLRKAADLQPDVAQYAEAVQAIESAISNPSPPAASATKND